MFLSWECSMFVQEIYFCHKVMLVNLIRTSVMEWTSWLQTDTIRCATAVAAVSHHPQDAVSLLHQRCDVKDISSFSERLSQIFRNWLLWVEECCFLPDEVSLQANDPLDDLLLGILGGPEGTINICLRQWAENANRKTKPNKNHTSVTL